MFKSVKCFVGNKQYCVCFDARTGEHLSIDVLVIPNPVHENVDKQYWRQLWAKDQCKPLTVKQSNIIAAAREALK